jgi:A/G-specific adenine glycosylase
MLQQTRVETVMGPYRRFLERFPTLESLARAPVEEALAAWSGLGYYRRARSLHAGARAVLERHDGRFPRDVEAALELPGVGPYTAGAVISIAYNLPVPAVDGNVERVVTRLLRLPGNPRGARRARELRAIVTAWIPPRRASRFNQALMELGATVCTPRSPSCPRCPLRDRCLARASGEAERYPEVERPQRAVPVSIEAAVVRRGGEFLFERVRGESYLEGLWLFPFAEGADSVGAALAKKLGVACATVSRLGRVRHSITYRRFTVEVLRVEPSAPIDLARRRSFRWARLEELGRSVPVSSLAFKIAALAGADLDPVSPRSRPASGPP